MTVIPTQITFRGMKHSEALKSTVRERVLWLEQFYAGVLRCRVIVEFPHRHHRAGGHVHVRIELAVPGGVPIVVSHEPSLHGDLTAFDEEAPHKDVEIDRGHRYAVAAIRDAFTVARRRLEDFAREQRGAVKTHETPA